MFLLLFAHSAALTPCAPLFLVRTPTTGSALQKGPSQGGLPPTQENRNDTRERGSLLLTLVGLLLSTPTSEHLLKCPHIAVTSVGPLQTEY